MDFFTINLFLYYLLVLVMDNTMKEIISMKNFKHSSSGIERFNV